jgi:hypothetical protein
VPTKDKEKETIILLDPVPMGSLSAWGHYSKRGIVCLSAAIAWG